LEFGSVVYKIIVQTDRQTDRQTDEHADHNTLFPYTGDRVTIILIMTAMQTRSN